MTSKRIDDLDVAALSDEELDAELKDSSVIVYRTLGGLVVVSIAGEDHAKVCSRCNSRDGRGDRENGIPKTLTEIRCHLLN
jgi:hypothetical protein